MSKCIDAEGFPTPVHLDVQAAFHQSQVLIQRAAQFRQSRIVRGLELKLTLHRVP